MNASPVGNIPTVTALYGAPLQCRTYTVGTLHTNFALIFLQSPQIDPDAMSMMWD